MAAVLMPAEIRERTSAVSEVRRDVSFDGGVLPVLRIRGDPGRQEASCATMACDADAIRRPHFPSTWCAEPGGARIVAILSEARKMKRNVHVQAACDRLLRQIQKQLHSLNDRRYIFERISRLRFTDSDDLRAADNLNRLADLVESSGVLEDAEESLDAAKDMERGYKVVSAGSMATTGKN